MSKKTVRTAGVVMGLALLAPGLAMAGSGGTEFTEVYDLLSGWAKGTLGKIIALAIFIVGLAAGIVRQSVVAAVAGIAGAMIMNYGPSVIENIVTAVI
ncbi:TraA family conjugative transfer protein [Duganella vulcania]|uniref:Pili assembly chaperone n=1 Tax=Duganella vulcania TaxID=2692166 RepID=A0A845GHD4_9BURK|nr:TraA family conjugative transfer protein [Duganella vulcania]MYM92706.1 pili assembly chaperone [Duganella vulcania]